MSDGDPHLPDGERKCTDDEIAEMIRDRVKNKYSASRKETGLPPAEQWAEDLYRTLVDDYDISERATSVIGMGYDDYVYVSATPMEQVEVLLALENEGYQPEFVDDAFVYRITPDFDGEAQASENNKVNEDEA